MQLTVTEEMYIKILPEMQKAFVKLECAVPPPKKISINGSFTYRYTEKQTQQAIIMKLARVISGIQATWHLLQEGFIQEAGAMQRILDELSSDIMFLAGSLVFGKEENIHKEFLDDFFQEEFEEGKTALNSQQSRHRVPRKKIRAYNARVFSSREQVSTASTVMRTIEVSYSGYIHAAGAHIMELYGGNPSHFHINGMKATPLQKSAFADFQNYLHRGLLDASISAKALGYDELCNAVSERSKSLARQYDMYD